jgi:hypothetical protein
MFDIHQKVSNRHDEADENRVEEYIEGLMGEFFESPEAQPVREKYGNVGWAATMMRYGFEFTGSSPPKMTLSDFEEVLYELFPRKVSVEAKKAEQIVAEMRAFWGFLARQYGLTNAQKILATLDDNTTSELEDLLDDPSNYGMAKSFVMMGTQAGFDMTTQEGLAAFQAIYNAKLLGSRMERPPLDPESIHILPPLLGPERPSGDALKKKRKEKRRQREAKRRNRR